MSIYTKQGDAGYSATLTGVKLPKNSPVFEVLGTLDELTSQLGLAKHNVTDKTAEVITRLQKDIMGVCGEIAGADIYVTEEKVLALEKSIDIMFSQLTDLKLFVIPGKTVGGAMFDVSRTIARRAEREVATLSRQATINISTIKWFNRISDFLFALARICDIIDVKTVSSTIESFSDRADMLCSRVIAKAREIGVKAVVAICDSGGNLVSLKRDDDSYIASIDIATNKAYTAVSLKMSTKELGELAKPNAPFYGVQHSNSKLIIFGGGVLLKTGSTIVGGLGVSGGTVEQDTELSEYGKLIAEGE